ncbi:uncharacterized protein [Littorina saxatilis]|uniref:Uncharacterized protein n=1 Tax=Littorina saxatilis TaxID=31220 RepID=A0AAN9ALR2_9CAEN
MCKTPPSQAHTYTGSMQRRRREERTLTEWNKHHSTTNGDSDRCVGDSSDDSSKSRKSSSSSSSNPSAVVSLHSVSETFLSMVMKRMKRMKTTLRPGRKLQLCIAVFTALLVIAAQIRPPCLWPYLVFKQYPKLDPEDNHDVTLVTGFFNLGHFEKAGETFGLYKYLHWAEVFQYVMNPLVVFTDSEQVENMLLQSRRDLLNRTVVIRVQRSRLNAFKSVEKIRTLFRDPQYPKHFPNTVIPEYPCSQHAKYEFVKEALERNLFPSNKYIAWIDIGYYRYLTQRRRRFYVITPPGMDESKIAMTQINPRDPSLFPSDVFRQNLVWVGGGMSMGTREVFKTFVEEYAVAMDTFLQAGLSNTDQQVIYSMYADMYRLKSKIQTSIQTYRWIFDRVCSCWFYLGYRCYREIE